MTNTRTLSDPMTTDAEQLAVIDGRVHVVIFPDLKRIERDHAEALTDDRVRTQWIAEQAAEKLRQARRSRYPALIVTS